jgi:polyisoprenoid-binding protein YceI
MATMHKTLVRSVFAALVAAALSVAPSRAAEQYSVDPMHTGISFKISHLGLSWVFGTFKDVSGNFTIDPDNAAQSSFALTIKADSIDTANAKRDEHLRSPDFFNTKQFPVLTFKSTSVRAIDGGYEVTGDFNLHGETRSITFPLKGGRKAQFPPGVTRTGYTAELILKRSDFGVGSPKFAGALGDEVFIAVSFEGTKK